MCIQGPYAEGCGRRPKRFVVLVMKLADEVVHALARLKTRFRLGVITNCDDDLFAASNKRLGVEVDSVRRLQVPFVSGCTRAYGPLSEPSRYTARRFAVRVPPR